MRAVLSMALVVVFAGTMHAQERAQEEPIGTPPAVQVQSEQAPVNASAAKGELPSSSDAAAVQAVSEQRAVEATAVRQGGPENRSWWWLVGAIVLAGIILVAIT